MAAVNATVNLVNTSGGGLSKVTISTNHPNIITGSTIWIGGSTVSVSTPYVAPPSPIYKYTPIASRSILALTLPGTAVGNSNVFTSAISSISLDTPSLFTSNNNSLELPIIPYIPRWMAPNYSNSSTFRKLYYAMVEDPLYRIMTVSENNFNPNFMGNVYQPRVAFIADYHYPKNYIPTVMYYPKGNTPVEVISKDSLQDLMYEPYRPCYFRNLDTLIFRNLEIVSMFTSSSSGALYLTQFATDPPLEDSPVILENNFSSLYYYDLTNGDYFPSTYLLNIHRSDLNADFTVYYASSGMYEDVMNGSSFITIDGVVTNLSYYALYNVWDMYAELMGITRRNYESNLGLKTRCQSMSCSYYDVDYLSAELGQSSLFLWSTVSPFSLSVSSVQNISIPGYQQFLYISEPATQVGSTWVCSRVPSGFVEVMIDTIPIDPINYIVSGSAIIPLTSVFSGTNPGDVTVNYIHNTWDFQGSELTPLDTSYGTYIGVASRKVDYGTYQKIDFNFDWNVETNITAGLGGFDF